MTLRKEQILFLVSLLLVAWLGLTFEVGTKPKKSRPKGKDEVAFSARDAILADASLAPRDPRELFREPSETRQLEPRQDLPFPAMRSLSVVMLPLPVGQHPGALSRLRRPVKMLPARQKTGNGNDPASGDQDTAPGPSTGDDPSTRYDRLYKRDGMDYWGLFLGPEQQKFELALNQSKFREGAKISFQWVDPKTGARNGPPWINHEAKDYLKIELAKTLRNEVGMAATRLLPGSHNTAKQRQFILYLMDKGRVEPWVFDKAMERAKTYRSFATPKEEGQLYVAKVLRAMGDLGGEWRLFKGLEKELQGSSFQLRGLGLVEARLGLDKLAEQHLRQAVQINTPIDPRNYAALATYLLDRGRAKEAMELARQAVDFMTRRDPIKAEQVAFRTLLVRACLALGDVDGADEAKETGALSDPRLINEAKYQDACIAYARQDFDAALSGFQECYASGLMADALLGLAATRFAKGEVEASLADFDRCADENPRMRHLALAGSGLVLGQIEGESANALEKIDASLVTNPIHPYTLYLQGRQRRLNGDLQGAVDSLKQALRQQDDFIEALAELTETYFAISQGNNDAGALFSAIRYVDRLVELDQQQAKKEVLFLEMQGRTHLATRDLRGARQSFDAGEKLGSDFCEIGLALLDYQQKRFDRSEERLQKMLRGLEPTKVLRIHIEEKLLAAMIDHSNKEQVVDLFKTKALGRIWESEGNGTVKLKPDDGVLRAAGQLRSNKAITAVRPLAGAGRFVEFSIDMLTNSAVEFAGVVISMPSRSTTTPSQFQIRLGADDRGKVLLEMVDGSKAIEPIRSEIDCSPGVWHSLRITAYPDPKNRKSTTLFLQVIFDDQVLFDAKVKGLRRGGSTTQVLNTGVRIEGRRMSRVDVSFRNFRRVQMKK